MKLDKNLPFFILLVLLFLLPGKMIYANNRYDPCLLYKEKTNTSISEVLLIFPKSILDNTSPYSEWQVIIKNTNPTELQKLSENIDLSQGCLIGETDRYTQVNLIIEQPVSIFIRNTEITFQDRILKINNKPVTNYLISIKENQEIIEENPQFFNLYLKDILDKKNAIIGSQYNRVYVSKYYPGLIIFSNPRNTDIPTIWTIEKIINFIEQNKNTDNKEIDYPLLEKKLYCFIKKEKLCNYFDLYVGKDKLYGYIFTFLTILGLVAFITKIKLIQLKQSKQNS